MKQVRASREPGETNSESTWRIGVTRGRKKTGPEAGSDPKDDLERPRNVHGRIRDFSPPLIFERRDAHRKLSA